MRKLAQIRADSRKLEQIRTNSRKLKYGSVSVLNFKFSAADRLEFKAYYYYIKDIITISPHKKITKPNITQPLKKWYFSQFFGHNPIFGT